MGINLRNIRCRIMAKYRIICLLLILTSSLHGQIETGSWRLHTATMRALDIAKDDQFIYTAYENGLMKYHVETKEKSLVNKMNGLSDILLSCLFYDSLDKALYIGYKNGNIDKIKDENIVNIPAIKLAGFSGSKNINRFYRSNEGVYVATDFGVVLINPNKNEIKDTYYPSNGEEPILDIEIQNQKIYALSSMKMYVGTVGMSCFLLPKDG